MATSLADQLLRLAVPQTNALADSNKRASLLFDPKEAANKDRETIYDIGVSGLDELILLNPNFITFESSLFDPSSKDLERSMESAEVNADLDKTLKKFLLQLSPYFLLQPAHKCLEWLIRRFSIHEYNKNEFMMLLLPYHETLIFTRCVQLMKLSKSKDRWRWLHCIQKPGISLSKQVLYNHAASNPAFLEFISQTVIEAVKVLDVRAHTLQAMFSFYCTTVIGAFETASSVNDSHISNVLPGIVKGLSSNVIDFTAACFMITGQLVTLTKISGKLLEKIINKICNCVHPRLQQNAIMLLTLIHQTQTEQLTQVSELALETILTNKWISTTMGQVSSMQGVKVTAFLIPLMTTCLKKTQLKDDNFTGCQKLLESLIAEIKFDDSDAELVIRCALTCYVLREKKTDEIGLIEISDDESDVMLNENNVDVSAWYSSFLRSLERQYSLAFDRVIKKIMRGKGEISESRKSALKTVLGFLLKAAYTDDDANVFENLYHHNANHRVQAVRYLVDNFDKMNITSDSKDLFKDSIGERLIDDNPQVVLEALKFDKSSLIELIGDDDLINKLGLILIKCLRNERKWGLTAKPVLHILTSIECAESRNKLFLTILPFLFPCDDSGDEEIERVLIILNSNFAKNNKFLSKLSGLVKKLPKKSGKKIIETVHNLLLKSPESLPPIDELIKVIDEISEKDLNSINMFYNILILIHGLPMKCEHKISRKVLELLFKNSEILKITLEDNEIQHSHLKVRSNIWSNQIFLLCIRNCLNSTDFSDILDMNSISLTEQKGSLNFILKLYEILITKFFVSKNEEKILYKNGLSHFLNTLFPDYSAKVKFLSYFFAGHSIRADEENTDFVMISPELQLRSIRLLNEILSKAKAEKYELEFQVLFQILIGLNCEFGAIREKSMDVLKTLLKVKKEAGFDVLIKRLVAREEELVMDHEQLALILFTILLPRKEISSPEKQQIKSLLNDLINYVANEDTPKYLSARLLEILKHINSPEILNKVSICGINILENTNNKKILNIYESEILRSISSLINSETVKMVVKSPATWNFIKKSLEKYNLLVHYICNKLTSPAILVMDVFDESVYCNLPEKHKDLFLQLVTDSSIYCENPEVITSAGKMMKRIEVDANNIRNEFIAMKNIALKTKPNIRINILSPDILTTKEWKRGVQLLEFLQNKKKLINSHVLISDLFDILKKCLEFEIQSPVEYDKQMILSCILHCCQKLSPDGSEKHDILPAKAFRIDLVVQCIRATQNPQTHHHALLLLCHTASMIPDAVLTNMMDIFTFMGSTVVRHENAYSFQIITKIIDSVIPILVRINDNHTAEQREQKVIPVLKVFSDIALDVPEHRRTPLYSKLIKTLGGKEFFWMFLGVIFESEVANQKKDKIKLQNKTSDDLSKRLEISINLAKEFEPEIVIETSTRLLEFVIKLPAVIENNPKQNMSIDITDSEIFDVQSHTDYQLRYFKYVTLKFISLILSSTEFVNKIAAQTDDENKSMKSYYRNLLIKILVYISEVSKINDNGKYWNAMLKSSYEILDHSISLFSTDLFLAVIHGLMDHALPTVRRKVIDLLNNKLLHKSDFLENCDEKNLIQIIDPLKNNIEQILEENNKSSDNVNHFIQQNSLVAVKLLSKTLAQKYPQKFKQILDILTEIIKNDSEVQRNVLASVILCLAEVCVNLKAQAISSLYKFLPLLIVILKSQYKSASNDPVLIATVTAIHKIIESLHAFLSPYLVKIIVPLAQISANLKRDEDQESKLSTVFGRLNGIFQNLSSSIPPRILIPTIENSYRELVKNEKYEAIGPVMNILSDCFVHIGTDEIQGLQNDLSNFFLIALEFRCEHQDLEEEELQKIEEFVMNAIVSLILKLSENTFKPLYYKIYDWAIRESTMKERSITFYKLSNHIAESLKSLFSLFAGNLVENASELLNSCNYSTLEDKKMIYFPNGSDQNIALIQNITKTFYLIFLHDSYNFVNPARFNILMQPLVDQLENEMILRRPDVKSTITMCLAQLAGSVSDDSLWKQLNYQVLMKTRSNNSEIRLFALTTCVAIAKKLGEDFSPLLPETIPFLSELLEDENQEIERACQKAVQDLEVIVGEPLQKYF